MLGHKAGWLIAVALAMEVPKDAVAGQPATPAPTPITPADPEEEEPEPEVDEGPEGDEGPDGVKDALIGDAKKHFQLANRLKSERRFREAAIEYRKSYDAVPREATLWNEAEAWRTAGENIEALQAYERYLALPRCEEGAPKLCSVERDGATKYSTQLKQLVGELEIVLEPGAKVEGIEIAGELLPLTAFPRYADPGTLEVFVVASGKDQRRRREAQMEAGQRTALLIAPFDEKDDGGGILPDNGGGGEEPDPRKDPALRKKRLRIAFYSSLGVTIASGAVTGVIGGLLIDAHNTYGKRCTGECGMENPDTGMHEPGDDARPSAAADRFNRLEPATTAMIIVTSGLVLTTVALALFAFSKGPRSGQRASQPAKAKPTAQFYGNGLRIRW